MSNSRSRKGYEFGRLSYEVIGACIDVQRQLGLHCMEPDYQRALALALPKRGLQFQREAEIPVVYDGHVVTKRRVDFLIWNDTGERLLLETKASSKIRPEDIEQCLLYLHQGSYPLCLLINFGVKPLGVQRLVHTVSTEKATMKGNTKGNTKDAKETTKDTKETTKGAK